MRGSMVNCLVVVFCCQRLISWTYSLIACSSERVQHPDSSGRHQGGQQEGGAGVQHLWAAEGVC